MIRIRLICPSLPPFRCACARIKLAGYVCAAADVMRTPTRVRCRSARAGAADPLRCRIAAVGDKLKIKPTEKAQVSFSRNMSSPYIDSPKLRSIGVCVCVCEYVCVSVNSGRDGKSNRNSVGFTVCQWSDHRRQSDTCPIVLVDRLGQSSVTVVRPDVGLSQYCRIRNEWVFRRTPSK